MLIEEKKTLLPQIGMGTKASAYFKLLKFRLSFTVSFSSAIGFILGRPVATYWEIALVMIGGLLVTGSANIINQIIEREHDKLMKRTAKRPLPTGQVSVAEAIGVCIVTGVAGLLILGYTFNVLTAALSLLSLILYGFVYTPLKRVSPICVFVGAIPGAMPPLLGWVAATGVLGVEAWILFGIQFMWQFPHFWAIAWVLDDDYKKAGFKMLPMAGGKNLKTAFQIMIYTLVLIPFSLLPLQFGMTGTTSALIAVVCGVLFLAQTFYLMRTCTKKAAMNIMFGSFLYLPIVQIAFVLDKVNL
ncbi:protoheme IX farnesyltransferase [Pontibacter sp. BT310]|jgi:heme o synthase|uniref:Protoheme IX farnesyltransferase n=1 Tax=Pontibacter populi TaxID=890055 RepID=A0ABS6X7Z8_9BACT|nr:MULTISPECIES: heme o synthase [Pontibacter]MBJ6116921.1 protoheme IX farnesyltransferase [Pontibacter sp. BT310]MBR0569345.1 heme o synthase [Microvirga sp. STS03]MBW3363774.1 heme o synthase [Pontibacter populi]